MSCAASLNGVVAAPLMPTINGVEQKVMGQFVISPPQWDGSLLQSCCALVSVYLLRGHRWQKYVWWPA
jgi:hypothetical protein